MARVEPGGWVTFLWQVTAGGSGSAWPLTAVIHYAQGSNQDERIVHALPAAPPNGTVNVSDLPFLSATNGWGPVERDMSVGEQAAGDGRQITIGGVKFTKGLGTNSVSDVQLYLGGHCSRFTATVGVDDEQGSAGSVTFSVIADGSTLITTARQTGSSANLNIDVPVPAGTQLLDLVVGDAGDGNGNDHGDWASPVLTCGGTLHSDAALSSLRVNGVPVPGFSPDVTDYANVPVDATHPPVISAVAADNGTVTITPPSTLPGVATVTVVSEDGTASRTYSIGLAPTSTFAIGGASGTVPATLSLTLGGPVSFGSFQPGVAKEYTASTTANVISTAGDAALTVSDPGHLTNGAFALPQPLQVSFSKSSWDGPVSNDPVTITFQQAIGATDPLRTGSYSKTLTFTLSTTTP